MNVFIRLSIAAVRSLVVIILTLYATPEALSQDTIRADEYSVSGYVKDSESGIELVGATVLVDGRSVGTVTDDTGFFKISFADPVSVNIYFSFVGYTSVSRSVFVDRNVTLDVELTQSEVGLGEIEVVGASPLEEVRSTQMSLVSLEAAEIEKLPAFLGEVDVIKSIQLLPGVQSGTEGSTGFYVRGGGPDQNLILMDGVPIYNASHVLGFLSIFNSDALQNVELIKGGFPARYGGRLSSVVNLNMKDGNLENYESDGVVGLVFSSFTTQGPIVKDRLSYIISGRRTYIDVLARPFLNKSLADGQTLTSYFYDSNAKLNFLASSRDKITLSAYLGKDVYGSTYETKDTEVDPVFRTVNSGGTEWGNRVMSLRWKRMISENLFVTSSLLYSRYRFDVLTHFQQIEETTPPTVQSEQIVYASGIEDKGARIDFDFQPRPSHSIRFGTNFGRHFFNPGVSHLKLNLTDQGIIDTTLTPNTFQFSASEGYLYFEDDIRFSERLQANLGVHGSLMSVRGKNYTSLEPRLALRYLLTPSWSAKASFGTMQQYLHLLTNTGINLPTDIWLAATDRVGPQRAWQGALGTALSVSDRYIVTVEGYYKDMRGLLEYEPGSNYLAPNTDWQDKIVVGRGWSYGAEFLIRKKRGGTTGWIGYTLSWTRRKFAGLNGAETFPYRYDRRHDLSVVLSHDLSDRVDVGMTWVYGTGQAITLASGRYSDARFLDSQYFSGGISTPELYTYSDRGAYRMAAYHRLDLVLNWHFNSAMFFDNAKSTLSFGAYNTYNRKNPFYIFSTSESNGQRSYKQASLFPVLPFVSYRFNF